MLGVLLLRRVRGWWILGVVGAGAWVTRVFSVCRAVVGRTVVVAAIGAAESEGVMVQGRGSAGWTARCAAVLMAALGAAGVAGCTTGGNPPPPTSPQPSTSVVATTSPAPPTTSAMSDDAAVIGALHAYVEAFNAAMKSLDPSEMMKLAGPGCAVCEADAANLTRDRSAGRRYEGGLRTLSEVQVVQRKDPNHYLLTARITTEAMVIRDATGRVVEEFKATSGPKTFVMAKINGVWRLDAVA